MGKTKKERKDTGFNFIAFIIKNATIKSNSEVNYVNIFL